MASKVVRGAVAQFEPAWLDAKATIDKVLYWIGRAADEGAEIVAFPEVVVPGYPWWIWHGPLAHANKYRVRYHENSIQRDGPEMRLVARAARDRRIVVVLGFSEYDRGSLYMAQATFSSLGELISVRRKLKPTHVERAIYGDGTGADLQVHDLSIGRVGALNCWEHFQPLSKYAMIAMGEQIHVASWPNMSNYAHEITTFGPDLTNCVNRTFAVEGQLFVLEAHNTISQAGVDFFTYDKLTAENFKPGGGCSRIWSPNGDSLGNQLGPEEEGLIVADLDFALIEGARAGADPVGHYSRPDIFQLHINRTPVQHVVEYWHGHPARPRGDHQLNGMPTTVYKDLLAPAQESNLAALEATDIREVKGGTMSIARLTESFEG